MSAPETSKREPSKDSSFLGNDKSLETMLTYLFDQQESTALETVFHELFRQVENKYLTNSENVSDKL